MSSRFQWLSTLCLQAWQYKYCTHSFKWDLILMTSSREGNKKFYEEKFQAISGHKRLKFSYKRAAPKRTIAVMCSTEKDDNSSKYISNSALVLSCPSSPCPTFQSFRQEFWKELGNYFSSSSFLLSFVTSESKQRISRLPTIADVRQLFWCVLYMTRTTVVIWRFKTTLQSSSRIQRQDTRGENRWILLSLG